MTYIKYLCCYADKSLELKLSLVAKSFRARFRYDQLDPKTWLMTLEINEKYSTWQPFMKYRFQFFDYHILSNLIAIH